MESVAPDATREPWYAQTVSELSNLNSQAETFFRQGKGEEAAKIMGQSRPLAERLLSVRRPSLEALESASDYDDLYGRMLLANRHYGWARLFFQKNQARWKNWQPRTPEIERRLKQAEAAIAECDRHIAG